MEHWRLLDVAFRAFIDIPPMLNAEALLEITVNPHFSDDISILREVRGGNELDQESRC
jgi:hypothetical protein